VVEAQAPRSRKRQRHDRRRRPIPEPYEAQTVEETRKTSRRNEGEKPRDREQDRGDAIGYVAQTGEEGNDERLERRTKRLHRPTKHEYRRSHESGTRENEAFFQTTGSDTLRPGKQERESRTKRSKHASRSFHRPTKHHAVDTGHESRSPEQATKDVLLRTVPSSTSLTVVCSGASYRRGFEGPLPSFASDSFRGTTVRSGRGESPCSPETVRSLSVPKPLGMRKGSAPCLPFGLRRAFRKPKSGKGMERCLLWLGRKQALVRSLPRSTFLTVVCSGASYLTGFRRSLPRCSIRRRRRSHDRERLDRNDGMSFVVDSGSTRCDQGTEREREAERPMPNPKAYEARYRRNTNEKHPRESTKEIEVPNGFLTESLRSTIP